MKQGYKYIETTCDNSRYLMDMSSSLFQVHGKPVTLCASLIPCVTQQPLFQPLTQSHIFATVVCLLAQATVEAVGVEVASLVSNSPDSFHLKAT